MRYWVGVTDNSWFDFLSRLQPDEVNFWQPSGKAPFANLEPGPVGVDPPLAMNWVRMVSIQTFHFRTTTLLAH